MKNLLLLIILVSLIAGCTEPPKEDERIAFLKSKGLEPAAYVISKFKDHDIVFIGEYHRIKHDVDLILELIPELYKNGIHTLAIEFGDYKDQPLVDSLLSLPVFDRKLAREIMFSGDPTWGYTEYIDIYKVAWEVNHDRKAGSAGFRIVNLAADYDPCKEGGAWKDLDPDAFMADVIFREIVAKNEKALIYSGCHHAFTKYHQPLYDFEKDTLWGYNSRRMGNLVYDSLKDKTFNIYLHASWVSDQGWDADDVLPVNGLIDSIMNLMGNSPVGFDVMNSPMGKMGCTNSYYALGYPDFRLEQFCDGYIFRNCFKNYMPITMEDSFITAENFERAKKHLLCILGDPLSLTNFSPATAKEFLFEDIRNHFRHLMK